jgi:hypothetical protein
MNLAEKSLTSFRFMGAGIYSSPQQATMSFLRHGSPHQVGGFFP